MADLSRLGEFRAFRIPRFFIFPEAFAHESLNPVIRLNTGAPAFESFESTLRNIPVFKLVEVVYEISSKKNTLKSTIIELDTANFPDTLFVFSHS